MWRTKIETALVLIATLCCAPSHGGEVERQAARLPVVDGPPQSTTQWIARSMRMNGLPMTIRAFESGLSVDDVMNHYEGWWRGQTSGSASRTRASGWRVLGLTSDQHHISIQIRRKGLGSEGTITVSEPPRKGNARLETDFPHPPSARLASLQEYDDLGVEAQHIDFTSARSVATEFSHFRELLEDEGWTVSTARSAPRSGGVHVLECQKGADLARLVFQPGRGVGASTSIVVVWRKS